MKWCRQVLIKNKISDSRCIDIFIENKNDRKIQNTDIYNYNENRINTELSTILEIHGINNINKYVYNFDACFEQIIQKFVVRGKCAKTTTKMVQ